ncbi:MULTISPECIES: hypothetical protein [Acidobacterium]|uniref:Putative membrane protein n=1 Tax=Acidobacterium capsulatum (strain ATCC 51196 / DSM 11244 / BCRC 80197 / JCM 7670 / NBRC 15755 / NCIMB 13165 / 161) TaxID=240015 RepID=C1F421_ACIC5|nr:MULTISPECIES: hypothetical protein [Acidobacterium]ACO31745.1 putative membrane protein [Acidobacterium capsulatum ATCC 51196]HCT60280.1 hypothetical protein [Acidobacterium sp.]
MRRPVGVIVAGILLLLSGLCGLLLIAVQIATMLITHSANAAMVPHGELVLLIFDGFIFAISVLSAWTGIALFRMRTWARYVTLVLAALGACFTGLAMMVCLLLLNTAPPVPNLAPATEHQVFLIAALVYGVMMLIAVFWIVYFNLASVRQAFAQAAAARHGEDAYGHVLLQGQHEHAPVSIAQIVVWITGVLFFLGGFSMVFLAWRQFPGFVLGWIVSGLGALLFDLLWACLLFYAGLGLLLRWRAGWIVAVFLQLYSLLSVFLLLLPGYPARMIHAMQIISSRYSSMPGGATAFSPETNARFLMAGSALSGAIALVILIALVYCRRRYLRAA